MVGGIGKGRLRSKANQRPSLPSQRRDLLGVLAEGGRIGSKRELDEGEVVKRGGVSCPQDPLLLCEGRA